MYSIVPERFGFLSLWNLSYDNRQRQEEETKEHTIIWILIHQGTPCKLFTPQGIYKGESCEKSLLRKKKYFFSVW